jgi:spore maturation protein A
MEKYIDIFIHFFSGLPYDWPRRELSMVMSWIFTGILAVSLLCSIYQGNPQALAAAVLQGAQAGVELAVAMAGSLCLWSGVGKLLDAAGIADMLTGLLKPALHRIFPSTATHANLSRCLSSNICANFLGLGNAATPMGIQAAKALKQGSTATDELCRLVVLNTASIQLIPANVAAVRSALGCTTPFDILPAVWITSLCSAGLGVAAAWFLGKVWKP